MDIIECVTTIFAKAAENIQCIFCQDDSCFKIIINNISNKVI